MERKDDKPQKYLELRWWNDEKGRLRHTSNQDGYNDVEIAGLTARAAHEAQKELDKNTKEDIRLETEE